MQITDEIFGLDISHHQGDNPDLARARAEGIEYVILKATEGNGFVDRRFAQNLKRARDAGLLVAAYHYQRSGISAQAQVSNVINVVPKDVPVIPDVEANSGDIGLTREIVRLLRAAGYHVPYVYIPRWYWQQIGSPSLAGLPPLWSSRYPDNVHDGYRNEYTDVPSSYWNGYGGLSVGLLQFTSSGRVAGYGPLDVNAFRGTRQELEHALLGKKITPEIPEEIDIENEDDSMRLSLKDARDRWQSDGIEFEVSASSAMWKRAWVQARSHTGTHEYRIEFLDDLGVIPGATKSGTTVELDVLEPVQVPKYCTGIRVWYKLASVSAESFNTCFAVTVFGSKENA